MGTFLNFDPPTGKRSISEQPWFIKPTLIEGEVALLVELPVALPYYHIKVVPTWNTGWWITSHTQANFMLNFQVPVPPDADLQVEVIG